MRRFFILFLLVACISIPTLAKDTPEMRGVWIASVANINFPSKTDLTASQLSAELDEIVYNVKTAGFNAIFFQVRPHADALYQSDIFPYSEVLSGTQGLAPSENFDILTYLLYTCHVNNIELHAWINPYRVTMNSHDVNTLAENNPARLHPEYTVPYADNKLYFNPALPEVRSLVVDGVKELLNKYPALDGIHFDDYFYPYPVANAAFDDSAAFAEYGNGMSLADFRRDNVNKLIRDTYTAIKTINPNCRFGVSPFGIWANESSSTPTKGSATNGLESYSSLYCDPIAWANEGIVDYLAPQIYWQFSSSSSAFDTVARWWNAKLDGTNTDLYIGHAAYKAEDFARNEIPIQVSFARSLLKYKGSIFYGYAALAANSASVYSGLKNLYSEPVVYSDPIPTGNAIQINYPVNNSTQSVLATYLLGSSDPSAPVYYNNEKISRTKDGYFSLYTSLSYGKNYFSLVQNNKTSTFSYNCTAKRNEGASYEKLSSFAITQYSPSAAFRIDYGETIQFSCVAPSGASVIAVIGGMSAQLKPTLHAPASGDGTYYKEVYVGSVKPSRFAKENTDAVLGNLKFKAEMDGESDTVSVGLVTQNALSASSQTPTEPAAPSTPAAPNTPSNSNTDVSVFDGMYAEVVNDYSHLKISASSSFYNDYKPINRGMRDYVLSSDGSYYKLRFGGYVAKDNVKLVYGIPLFENRLIFSGMQVNALSTLSRADNTTDIYLGILENVPNNVNVKDNKILWTLYNTNTNYIPQIDVIPNPLISDISGAASGSNKIIYTITLKNSENYYGFDVKYEEGTIILKLNNPQSLAVGDKPLYGKTIVVDAGHGGTDAGAMGPSDVKTGLHEKQLNLAIAIELEKYLTAYGANVIMTRSSDVTVELLDRVFFLNEKYPDMAISVHHNSLPQASNPEKVRGYLQLYTDNAGLLLAKTVSKTACDELARYERAFYSQSLAVARNHRFPSILSEMSYLTCVEDFQWALIPGNAAKSGKALANGIVEYYRVQEKYLEY